MGYIGYMRKTDLAAKNTERPGGAKWALAAQRRDAAAGWRILALMAVLFWFCAIAKTSAAWEPLPPLPVAAGNFASSAFGGGIVVAGGITWQNDAKVWLDTIWRFDTKGMVWSEGGKLPHPLAYPAYGQTAEGIFVAGGGDGNRSRPESGRLDARLQFRKVGVVSQPLIYSASALAGGKLYVAAGATDAVDLATATNLFYAVNLKTGDVKTLGEYPGGKLIVATAAALDGRIYVFGGATFNSANQQAVNVDSAFAYSIDEGKWSRLKPFPLPARGLASCALDDRHILLAGGYREEFSDRAFIYNTKTGWYFETKPLPYRAMVTLIKAGSDVYCIGGEDRSKHRTDRFYRAPWKQLLR